MKKTILIATAGALAFAASPALAKGHAQPADSADFGQNNAGASGAKNADARGLTDGEKGVDGGQTSDDAKNRDRPASDPKAS